MRATLPLSKDRLETRVHSGPAAEAVHAQWNELRRQCGETSSSRRFEWMAILREGLKHHPYCIEARRDDTTVGLLPLCFLNTKLFGKFLVGMPYLNVGGVLTQDETAATELIDHAVKLADELDVKYLELRHEHRWAHAAFNHESTQKVHMRLSLPATAEELWGSFKPKVRNQIRKAEQNELSFTWGGREILSDYYRVFAINMRDLGTPVFGRGLFSAILERLPGDAEICVVRLRGNACAAGLLLHGDGVTEVPSASSLRKLNHLNANMLLYWQLLCRSIERGQSTFDFGRSSADSNTYKFKAQWGAKPHPAVWQYYVRQGAVGEMRPDNPKLQRRIAVWKRLPVWLTRLVGPSIVRGIP